MPYVYGIHAVRSALERKRGQCLYLARSSMKNSRLVALSDVARQFNVPVKLVERDELDSLSEYQRHQGAVLDCAAATTAEDTDLMDWLAGQPQPPLVLVLDGIQDPHNLGACLRSADAAGVHAVVLPRDRAVGITATVRKVASGAAEHVPVYQVTNLAQTLKQLKQSGIWLIGADERGEHAHYNADLAGPIAIVVGAEGKGLRRLTREHCDMLVAIPMVGHVDSLNVSVATGILLYEAVRQRRQV